MRLARGSSKFDFDPTAKEPDWLNRARRIVLKFGWNSTSYQILNPGILRWFSETDEAVVGYVTRNGVRVVAGAPVCSDEALAGVVIAFERDAARQRESVCYVCAERRLESIIKNQKSRSTVILGAQPVWKPSEWASIVAQRKSLRQQINRAQNKGLKVAEWIDISDERRERLRECLELWLANKSLPTLHFLVEPNTLLRLADRRVFVAERDGEVFGFVVLSPIALRNGWLFEQFVHRPDSPNGTMELLIGAAMAAVADEGAEYATLGLAPLSTRAQIEPFENPLWLRWLLKAMRNHSRKFYNFDGLDAFKNKLRPNAWEPVFAISNEPRFSINTLYAIASALSGGSPFYAFMIGMGRVTAKEVRWAVSKFR